MRLPLPQFCPRACADSHTHVLRWVTHTYLYHTDSHWELHLRCRYLRSGCLVVTFLALHFGYGAHGLHFAFYTLAFYTHTFTFLWILPAWLHTLMPAWVLHIYAPVGLHVTLLQAHSSYIHTHTFHVHRTHHTLHTHTHCHRTGSTPAHHTTHTHCTHTPATHTPCTAAHHRTRAHAHAAALHTCHHRTAYLPRCLPATACTHTAWVHACRLPAHCHCLCTPHTTHTHTHTPHTHTHTPHTLHHTYTYTFRFTFVHTHTHHTHTFPYTQFTFWVLTCHIAPWLPTFYPHPHTHCSLDFTYFGLRLDWIITLRPVRWHTPFYLQLPVTLDYICYLYSGFFWFVTCRAIRWLRYYPFAVPQFIRAVVLLRHYPQPSCTFPLPHPHDIRLLRYGYAFTHYAGLYFTPVPFTGLAPFANTTHAPRCYIAVYTAHPIPHLHGGFYIHICYSSLLPPSCYSPGSLPAFCLTPFYHMPSRLLFTNVPVRFSSLTWFCYLCHIYLHIHSHAYLDYQPQDPCNAPITPAFLLPFYGLLWVATIPLRVVPLRFPFTYRFFLPGYYRRTALPHAHLWRLLVVPVTGSRITTTGWVTFCPPSVPGMVPVPTVYGAFYTVTLTSHYRFATRCPSCHVRPTFRPGWTRAAVVNAMPRYYLPVVTPLHWITGWFLRLVDIVLYDALPLPTLTVLAGRMTPSPPALLQACLAVWTCICTFHYVWRLNTLHIIRFATRLPQLPLYHYQRGCGYLLWHLYLYNSHTHMPLLPTPHSHGFCYLLGCAVLCCLPPSSYTPPPL